MPRVTPAAVAVGSLAALVLLGAGLYWHGRADAPGPDGRPLVAYVAASFRAPMEAIARDYRQRTGRRVEMRFGASEDILHQAELAGPSAPADLFLPADDSYVGQARDKGLVAETFPVAVMRAVVLTPRGNPKGVTSWADLTREGMRVAVPNPAAAVGKLTRDHLARTGRWTELRPRVVDTGTVTEAANAAKLGTADAAVVWDAVAAGYPGQPVVRLPELDGVVARVELAVLSQSPDLDAARDFARYATDPDGGLREFRKAGFRPAGEDRK